MGWRWAARFKTIYHWKNVSSIAIPPFGAGNGGLDWQDVKPKIESALSDLQDVDVLIFEPTEKYQNIAKNIGV